MWLSCPRPPSTIITLGRNPKARRLHKTWPSVTSSILPSLTLRQPHWPPVPRHSKCMAASGPWLLLFLLPEISNNLQLSTYLTPSCHLGLVPTSPPQLRPSLITPSKVAAIHNPSVDFLNFSLHHSVYNLVFICLWPWPLPPSFLLEFKFHKGRNLLILHGYNSNV